MDEQRNHPQSRAMRGLRSHHLLPGADSQTDGRLLHAVSTPAGRGSASAIERFSANWERFADRSSTPDSVTCEDTPSTWRYRSLAETSRCTRPRVPGSSCHRSMGHLHSLSACDASLVLLPAAVKPAPLPMSTRRISGSVAVRDPSRLVRMFTERDVLRDAVPRAEPEEGATARTLQQVGHPRSRDRVG
jgi:hypothetical protein